MTKKPSADPLLSLALEAGSFDAVKVTVDATNALNDAKTVSARFIAQAADQDRNFGGFRGNSEYLVAPSIRFKNGVSDYVLSFSSTRQVVGTPPYVLVGGTPFDIVFDPGSRIGVKDQGIAVDTDLYSYDATQKLTDWLSLVSRGQYQRQRTILSQYAPQGFLDPEFYPDAQPGDIFVSGSPQSQSAGTWSFDSFARLKFDTFGLRHTLVGGMAFNRTTTALATASDSFFERINIGDLPVFGPLSENIDTPVYVQRQKQYGYYVQDILEFGKFHLSGSLRYSTFSSRIRFTGEQPSSEPLSKAWTPAFGAVFDVTKQISLFANYVKGFEPGLGLQSNGEQTPNGTTQNIEAGVKAGFFDGNLQLTASLFRLRQSNRTTSDPADPIFVIPIGGAESKGIDVDLSGQILKGWLVQSSFTYTSSRLLEKTSFETVVVALPKFRYSVYTGYQAKIAERLSSGASVGLYGQSSSYGEPLGLFRAPSSYQIDANAFLVYGPLRLNAGVKNVFDRRNYDVTFFPFLLPRRESRNWRVTATYSFL